MSQKVKKKDVPRADNDTAWKEILREHLKDFIEFFWNEAYQDIDWTKPYEFLEQELMAIESNKEESSKKFVDKLFKVYLMSGKEQWILLHIEVQNSNDSSFETRMFTYCYRIFDRYQKDIASMAVLADNDEKWRPNKFHQKIWKSEITRIYEVVKLIDYKGRETELLQSDNPFAMVVLLQLAANDTRPDDQKRLLTKLEFFRCLHKHGWSIGNIMNMYQFLDTILSLSKQLEVQYIKQAKEIDQERNMNLTLTAERHGFEQGQVSGYQLGEAHILKNLLKLKFKEIPKEYLEKIDNADVNTLEQWCNNFVFANSLEEVFRSSH